MVVLAYLGVVFRFLQFSDLYSSNYLNDSESFVLLCHFSC